MNKVMRFDCVDKNELVRAFVTNEALVKPESCIMSFGHKLETLVTRTNRAKVPTSSKIALATGKAKLTKNGGLLGIRVADDGSCARVTLDVQNRKGDITEEQWSVVNSFLDDLESRGYNFERQWS